MLQEPEIKSVPIVVKFDDAYDVDNYSEDSVPLTNPAGNTTINVDSSSSGSSTSTAQPGDGITLYYIGVEGSTKSTTIDPERSWAAQIARVYGFPCTVGAGGGGLFSPERVTEYKALLKRFTFWVSAVNVLMFIVALLLGGGFAGLGTNVFIGPTDAGLSAAGAKYTYKIVYELQFHRLVIAVLHHYGLVHLAVNLYAQLRLGVYAEAQWGLSTFALIYGAGGIGGVLLSAIFNPETISVGASGAMAGALAALLFYVYAVPEPRDPIRKPAIVQIGILATLYLIMSASGHIDFCAHIGGALVGVLFALALWGGKLESVTQWPEALKKLLPIIMYAIMALYFFGGLVVLYVYVYAERILK